MNMAMSRFALAAMLLLACLAAVAYAAGPPFTPQRYMVFDGAGFTYQGAMDPLLSEQDWLQFSTSVRVYCQVYDFPERCGLIGIVNNTGTVKRGFIKLHLANMPEPNPEKLIWQKIRYIAGGETDFSLVAPDGFEAILQRDDSQTIQYEDGFFEEIWDATIQPNPSWEEFVWEFEVEPNKFFLIDRWEIATVCVPEPASMLALAGLSAAALFRRRRTK